MPTITDPTAPVNTRKPARGVCRLTMHINGVSYAIRPIPCDPDAARRAFRLRKADGSAYFVAETLDGAECSCPDWVFHRDGIDPGGCKHIKALVATGLLAAE